FCLTNLSDHPVSVPTPTHSIHRCVALEVYDSHERLFFRKDEGTRGTVFLGPSGYPMLRIEAHGSVDDITALWLSPVDYGVPPAGKYYVRIAFPLVPMGEDNRFSVSKAFEFTIPPKSKADVRS